MKRFFAILLCLVMVCALVACNISTPNNGNNDNNGTNGTNGTNDNNGNETNNGGTVNGTAYRVGLGMTVESTVSPAEDGRCVVVLACREYLAETTQLRHQTAQIVLHSYTGLRLPSICLRQSEDGTLGVYCAQGGLPQFKPVNMVYQGDDYVLVSVPTGTGDRSILRPGDEVLMTGVTLDGTQILTGD